MQTKQLTRRNFLKLSALSAGSVILAACSSSGSAGNQVRLLIDSWALSGAPFKEMAEKWNQLHPEATVKIEPSPGNWMTKVTGQIRAGNLQWCGAGVMTTFNDLAAWVQLGMVQPVENYISQSTVEGASSFFNDMLPAIREDGTYNGKFYGIPFSVENITYQWNMELFSKAGIQEAPKTWQELYDYGKELRDALAAEGTEKTYPFAFDLGALSRNLGALFTGISDHPYTEEGLLDWDSQEMHEALRFMRKLSADGITPPSAGEGLEIYDLWMRGRIGGLYSCSSRGVWAQKTLGFDKISTGRVPTSDGNAHSGTVFWGNSVALLNTAPMPQQAMDFLLYCLGPQNTDWQKAIIRSGQSPAFQSTYNTIIGSDPEFSVYRWMTEVRDEIAISVLSPKNYYYPIQNEAWNRHRPEYLKDGSTMTEAEVITKIKASTREIMDQVRQSVATIEP